jgi:hypothetical protein
MDEGDLVELTMASPCFVHGLLLLFLSFSFCLPLIDAAFLCPYFLVVSSTLWSSFVFEQGPGFGNQKGAPSVL